MKINWRAIRIPKTVQRILFIAGSILLIRILLPDNTPPAKPDYRVEQVRVTDWSAVDPAIRKVFIQAGEQAEQVATKAVHDWVNELRKRAKDEFIPWYFGYWNQQALALKAAGYHVMSTDAAQGMFGKQPTASEQIEKIVEEAFMSRVLQPATAQLKIEAITKEAVQVYLSVLNRDLKAVQADYQISDQEWDRYMTGVTETLLSLEGSRQVPLLLKGVTVGSGVAAIKIGQTLTAQIRMMLLRRGSQEMIENGMMYAGRTAARGFGGIAFALFTGWDLYDHHRTVSQNAPVMERLINEYFDHLENLVLRDSQCGIFQTLEEVKRTVSEHYKGT